MSVVTLAVCSPNLVTYDYEDSRSGFEKAHNNLVNRFKEDGGISEVPPSSAKNYKVVRLIKIGKYKDLGQDACKKEEIYNLSLMTYRDSETDDLRWIDQPFDISFLTNHLYGDVHLLKK